MCSSRIASAPPLLVLLFFTTCFPCIPALRFYLQDRERRCFKFDAPFSSRVIGERSIANGPGHAELSIEVKSTSGKIVYEAHVSDPKDSKFAFVTPAYDRVMTDDIDFDDYEYDDYERDAAYHVCLILTFDAALHKTGKRAVTFWVRPEASQQGKPSDKHASENTMGTMTSSLEKMHTVLQKMVSDLTALQQRERRLVKRSRATATGLTLYAVIAIVVLVATSATQFLFFKSFFKSKKLL